MGSSIGSSSNDVMRKYLARYAEQEVTLLADFPANIQFHHCIVIPAYNETAEFFTRLQLGPLHKQNALCVVVINQPDNDAGCKTNALLMQQICLSGEVLWHSDNIQLLRYGGSNNYWLVVDRFNFSQTLDRRLPRKEGVGLARKIGCDIATALYARAQIQSGWIHCTDADTFLPRDYFKLPAADAFSAAVYDFKHQNDGSALGHATALYEQALSYYVKGLMWADSPYAHHTIGSIIAVNVHSYCHVRGFPKRSGGEDFYLLNKLTKIGKIFRATDRTVRIKARESSRVPFGTGPAVADIMALDNPAAEYTWYNPQNFYALRQWLATIPRVWADVDAGRDPFEQLPPPIIEALQAVGWQKFVKHLREQVNTLEDGTRAIHDWFDAFLTLKFIHYLQRHYFPALPLADCLTQAEFMEQQ